MFYVMPFHISLNANFILTATGQPDLHECIFWDPISSSEFLILNFDTKSQPSDLDIKKEK